MTEKVDPALKLPGADGPEVSWRRLTANAEGLVDLGPLAGSDSSRAVYLHVPLASPADAGGPARPRHQGRRRGLARRQGPGDARARPTTSPAP